MKKLGKKMATEAGTLVSYACICMCFASCRCLNESVNPSDSVDYTQEQANNIQNDSKMLVIHMTS